MSYSDDEKRLLAHAAEATQQFADVDTTTRRSTCRRAAGIKRALAFAATLAFVAACSVMVVGLSSLAIGTTRPCHDVKVPQSLEKVKAAPAVDAAAAATTTSPFSRLIDAVSPDTLHDLLHEYFPDMYKHGVYPSEKSALEVIHRKNAALATSLAQLARRDLNTTSSAIVPTSSVPSSTVLPTVSSSSVATPSSTTASTTSSTASTSASGTTTATSHTTLTTAALSSSKVTSVYTSTINGTPTVVTATSVVGVAATNPTSTSTATGSLQTGAAVPLLSGANAQLAKAVAGVVVGAMLI